MESSDFYLKEFTNRNFSSYDKKYIQGKNVIDCRLEDYIFLKYLKNIKSNVKVLEVGFFSQRITKKLRKYFQVIFSTEYSSQMLDPKNHNQLLFDWAKNKIDKDPICGHLYSASKSSSLQSTLTENQEKIDKDR